MNVFAFNIKTIPDIANGRRLYGDPQAMRQLSDEEVARVMFHHRAQEIPSQEKVSLRYPLHKIVVISLVFWYNDILKVWSLGETHMDEAEIIQHFFDHIENYHPLLISWNGNGFDLPILHYRALLHGITAPVYWETKTETNRLGHYTNRYHDKHLDLMALLAAHQPKAMATLDDIATLLGFPGKKGLKDENIWEMFLAGNLLEIRDDCEMAVLNTYLIFLRFELMRGHLTLSLYQQACQQLKQLLQTEQKPHLQKFLQAWQRNEVFLS